MKKIFGSTYDEWVERIEEAKDKGDAYEDLAYYDVLGYDGAELFYESGNPTMVIVDDRVLRPGG